MPEEINRLVTDSITNYFFTTSETANNNLIHSGVSEKNIFFVGNTMIDTLLVQMPYFKKPCFWDDFELREQQYIVMTLHRPSNVDSKDQLTSLIKVIEQNTHQLPVIFPVHPRTRGSLESFGISINNIKLVEPMSYHEFNYLVKNAKAVITDSGGITEETTVMSIPCMTLRNTTERPETCTIGTNKLIGTKPEALETALKELFAGNWKVGGIPPLWDGKTADRIVKCLIELY